jgi:adenine-specific DNA methylase
MSTISAVDTLLSSLTSSSSSYSSSSSSYESIFDTAISNASTTSEKAKIVFAKTQYEDLNILFNMGSTDSDSSTSSYFGTSSTSSLADQISELSFILDQDNTTPGASTSQAAIDKATALVAQTLLTKEMMSIGKSSTSSAVDSLI